MQSLRIIFSAAGLAAWFSVLGLSPAVAQTTIGLNPPADPRPVGGAVLAYQRHASVPRLTIPGSFSLTETVTNRGSLPATNVQVHQDLPPGWTVDGRSSLDVSLGTIAINQTVTHQSTITVSIDSGTGRFPNEATVAADGLDPVEATAPVDLTHPEVLGASTLAETGRSPLALITVGAVIAWLGVTILRRAESA